MAFIIQRTAIDLSLVIFKKVKIMDTKIWTIKEILNWGDDYFKNKGVEQPRLHIEHLLSEVLKMKRLELYLAFERELLTNELSELKAFIKRILNGEPLMYILGKTEFHGALIRVNQNVLIPRPETEIMIDEIIKSFKNKEPDKILDLGTGSGCISISLAKHFKNSKIKAVDISEKALSLASENALLNNVQERIEFINGDMINFLKNESEVSLIAANPPYISKEEYENLSKSVKNFEPMEALTDKADGTFFLSSIIDNLQCLKEKNGLAFIEFGNTQLEWIKKHTEKNNLKYEIIKDIHKISRIIKIFS